MADQPTGQRRSTGATGESAGAGDDTGASRPDYWSELGIDPIEIALPRGTGYTLRAYRPESGVTPSAVQVDVDQDADDVSDVEDDVDDDVDDEVDGPGHDDLARRSGRSDNQSDEDDVDTAGSPDEDASDEDASDEDVSDEDVPLFLGTGGRLFLFATPEALVEFVRSGAPNDLTQLDAWSELVKTIQAADVVPDEDDSYELDLVVENLRGGYDAWDGPLLIKAGEIARDLGYAYQVPQVLATLASGSPLDELDEALRAADSGGIGGFFARRRVRRIGVEQAAIGWRSVIGRISGLVDWRE